MPSDTIKIRAKEKNGEVVFKALISHEMESGLRKDKKTGETIPAHFIQEVTVEHKNDVVMKTYWSGGISKNPYLSFTFTGGKKGDEVKLSWVDNKGESDSATATIS
jgi:sulfur-oxidizing protein SoxZ